MNLKIDKITFVSTVILIGLLSLSFYFRTLQGPDFDPRNHAQVLHIRTQREARGFRNRLYQKRFHQFFIPGIKAAHLSFLWMETLTGLANDASVEEDFSWLFSKLYTFTVSSHPNEIHRVLKLSPFLYVIGKDQVGSTLLAFETIKRRPQNWQSWFWAAFHSLENLKANTLAGDLYYKAANFPESPSVSAALGLRLSSHNTNEDLLKQAAQQAINEMPALVVEKLKRARPEYFN